MPFAPNSLSNEAATECAGAVADLLGPAGYLPAGAGLEKYHSSWTGDAKVRAPVLRPIDTTQTAEVMRRLHALGQAVALQGGMTGLVGGSLPEAGEVIVSTERMTELEIDPLDATALVGAGVTLQALNDAAAAHGLFFPVDIGARGSATLGGMIATNAGGNRVLRHGMTRSSVLGLEVVLADGTVLNNLSPLIKNNTGYDLKHLFIGAEGTLGIVTRARLKLEPLPALRRIALVALPDVSALPGLLVSMRAGLGPELTAFEVMWRDYLDVVAALPSAPTESLPEASVLVLIEGSGRDPHSLEEVLSSWLELNPEADVRIAQSDSQSARLWAVRDASGEAAQAFAPFAGFDITLKHSDILPWVAQVSASLHSAGWTRVQTYGHFGDGNIHLVIGLNGPNPEERAAVDALVYGTLNGLDASVSAEHGIGRSKKSWLNVSRSREEIATMRAVKATLDPKNLLNRNRIFNMEDYK